MSRTSSHHNPAKAELIIVGAGLSGLITAWRVLDVNPDINVILTEASDRIAGDHTWSFNLSDIPEHLQDWVEPFIAYRWPKYDVMFPDYTRTLDIEYCTGNSDSLRNCVQPHIDSGRLQLMLNTKVDKISVDSVTLDGGEVLTANAVLDARGFEPNPNVHLGYQKFVGHTIKTIAPHGLTRPIIMDATVDQLGGYRFVYCLPFTDHEILVEDTYYTDGPELHSQELDARIKDYIRDQLGVSEYELVRREKGVLPITLAAKPNAFDLQAIGIRGGFYHAVTGYSLPNAVRVADGLTKSMAVYSQHFQNHHFKSERFFRLLNRMLFRAAKTEERYKVLQRFYRLSPALIRRFYAGELTLRDKLRILIGKPPVPVSKALQNFSESAFIRREKNKAQHD